MRVGIGLGAERGWVEGYCILCMLSAMKMAKRYMQQSWSGYESHRNEALLDTQDWVLSGVSFESIRVCVCVLVNAC